MKLHSVQTPADEPKDVTMLLRADILKRDWSSAMKWADRQKPVELSDTRKRNWR